MACAHKWRSTTAAVRFDASEPDHHQPDQFRRFNGRRNVRQRVFRIRGRRGAGSDGRFHEPEDQRNVFRSLNEHGLPGVCPPGEWG